ncbi:hypothetical protein BKA62DRAFT_704588 [Auriculariales sp. MPI-PUGE-AT-0066]|nr:hypothetical protein BKA62DRAFT_704588 [Auriculariales sp. MPI-PUGE-AT-0066]
MSDLHNAFLSGQQQRFQRILESLKVGNTIPNPPSSLSTSAGTTSRLTALNNDINARDEQGRTVLHLACASLERSALECVRLLLGHPHIHINVQDNESHWTPLHRAMYAGNLEAALILLQRHDIDTKLKDYEGYTAFDLYNSTVKGTVPERDVAGDVYTWGSNRNANLGHGDADDRALPDLVDLPYDDAKGGKPNLFTQFNSVPVRAIVMARLHTAILTTESQRNVRLCGIANSGRLGPSVTASASGSVQIQYAMAQLASLSQSLSTIALGQDHTLAVSTAGEVFSWGSNKAGQLGYIDAPEVQPSPRKLAGNLRKEKIAGVAASRTASACWTEDGSLYTWGTHNGQLGYDRTQQAVQALPRRVTTLEEPVASVALSDNAMACLLKTTEVLMYWRDAHFKLVFAVQGFPASMNSLPVRRGRGHNGRALAGRASILKVATCEGQFVALSHEGAVFTFSPPTENDRQVKPQRVWDVRKQFSVVKDVAIGLDGAIVLCTESGHVYLRQPNPAKFQKVSYLQRVTNVAASPTGSYAAIRVDTTPEKVTTTGETMTEQLAKVTPYWGTVPRPRKELKPTTPPTVLKSGEVRIMFSPTPHIVALRGEENADDDDDVDARVRRDIAIVRHLCEVMQTFRAREIAAGKPVTTEFPHGGDVVVQLQGTEFAFPAHLVVLLARCPALRGVLAGTPARDTAGGVSIKAPSARAQATIAFSGVQPLAVLLLLEYVYTDEVVLAWEPRVGLAVEVQYRAQRVRPGQLRAELQALARALGMDELERALGRVFPTPPSTLALAMKEALNSKELLDTADVVLELKDDQKVKTHSSILRARSPFFKYFLDDPDWTAARRGNGGKDVLVVDLKHLAWREMEYVMKWIYTDVGEDLFAEIHFVKSANELVDFYFSVMAVADELLLDKLILICSSCILRHINIWNACSLLTDASQYFAHPLIRSIQGYIACNLETMLESRLLDSLGYDVLKRLAIGLQERQVHKAPYVRTSTAMDELLGKWVDWLDDQDIPTPIVRTGAIAKRTSRLNATTSPKASPTATVPKRRSSDTHLLATISPLPSPTVVPSDYKAIAAAEDIFEMDEMEDLSSPSAGPSSQPSLVASAKLGAPRTALAPSSSPTASGFAWKTSTANSQRTDLRAIIAETMSANSQPKPSSPVGASRQTQPAPVEPRATPPSSLATSRPVLPNTSSSGPAWRINATPPSPHAGPSGVGKSSPSPQPSSMAAANARHLFANPPASSPRLGVSAPAATALHRPSPPVMIPAPSDPRNRTPTGPTTSPLPMAPRRPPSPTMGIRRVSSGQRGPAWTPMTAQPSEPVTAGVALPFAAIQQQERERLATPSAKPKQNLREIQEEQARIEAEQRVAQREEEEFMRWWNEEEARVKLEEERQAQALARFGVGSDGNERGGKGGAVKKRSHKKKGGGGQGAAQGSKSTVPARIDD